MCARAKGIFPSQRKKKDLLVSRQRALCYFCSLPNMHPCIMGTQGGERWARFGRIIIIFNLLCAAAEIFFFLQIHNHHLASAHAAQRENIEPWIFKLMFPFAKQSRETVPPVTTFFLLQIPIWASERVGQKTKILICALLISTDGPFQTHNSSC